MQKQDEQQHALEINQKELESLRSQVDDNKKLHEKEIRSIQNQTRAAYAELQNLRKSNIKTQNILQNEIMNLRQKLDKLSMELQSSKDNSKEKELLEKNFQWAKDNNELRAELVKTEQIAITAKLQAADIASNNDKLKHQLHEYKKQIHYYKKMVQKNKQKDSKSRSEMNVSQHVK